MNKLITVNLSYYNQPKDVLMQHINNWKKFPEHIKKQFTFFIIDDCSKKPVIDLLKNEDLKDLDLHIYRVKKDLYCNIAGVRNLGATECKTPWIVILDMDTIILPKLAETMIKLAEDNINKNNAFKFNRIVPNNPKHIKHHQMHPAVCLIRREDYWNIGGCEEDLVGHYGHTDPIFWYRANGKIKVKQCTKEFLLYEPEGESDINRSTGHNANLFREKQKTGKWSTDFIRFKWEKI